MSVEGIAGPMASFARAASIPDVLLNWYDREARVLPWRVPPGGPSPDPYRVWLSEVMLQQTTVATVTPRFARFLERFPTVEALAQAAPDALMAEWAGLGYYARARNLQAGARAVVARGGFPRTAAELVKLPGIGPYTAAAIAAMAFGEAVAVVDGNAERVVARLFALDEQPPALVEAVRQCLQPLVPAGRPGDFAQAVMDLGARVCRPKAPACDRCPLAGACQARAESRAGDLPLRKAKPEKRLLQGTAWWIEADGRVGLERRPGRGLLGGMLGVPGTTFAPDTPFTLPFEGAWRRSPAPVRHIFTHIDLRLDVAAIRLHQPPPWPVELAWTGTWDLTGLPSLYRKVAQQARALLED